MVTSLALGLFTPMTRDVVIRLRARLYKANRSRPVARMVYTQTNRTGRSARFDLVMGGQQMQPHIHSGMVTVIKGHRIVQFFIFVKNHRRLPLNTSTPFLAQASWKGDIIVLKKGLVHDIVSLDRRDYAMADFAVEQFIMHAPQRPRYRIPMERDLIFHMV